jgi:hypothetical protein
MDRHRKFVGQLARLRSLSHLRKRDHMRMATGHGELLELGWPMVAGF